MSEETIFECRFEVRWADLDANRHVRNTAYSEYATTARFRALTAGGIDQATLEARRFGPVITREEARYRRELHFGESVVVRVYCSGLSDDGSHWRIFHELRRGDGRESATITVEGGWIDLAIRKLALPPPELAAALQAFPRTPDFEVLPSLLRRRAAPQVE